MRVADGMETLLQHSAEQYRLVMDALPVLIAYIDVNYTFAYVNKAYADWYHRPLSQLIGLPITDVMEQEWCDDFIEHYQLVRQGKTEIYETTMFTRDDHERYVSVTLIPHMHNGEMLGAFSLISDMTPRMNYLATHDSLTNLPNRSLFNARLAHAMKHVDLNGGHAVLMFLDLDHFKNINDTLGHDVGDQLLIKVVERIKNHIYKSDTLARLGGDEFTILLEENASFERARAVAKHICDSMAEVIKINDHDLFVTMSIGISVYPDDADNMQKLLKNADMAMYRAKERGRNTFEFYTDKMNDIIQRKLIIENNLRNALDKEELKIYYQPIIDFKTSKICGLEALLRWQSPELGFVSPAEFVPVAIERGLIVPIGEWVMRTACKQIKIWQQAGYSKLYLSLNLSARQFLQNDFVEMIAHILSDTGLDGKYLVLELTENMIMGDVDYSVKMVKALKGLDITISLDDFGTGYASMGYLKRFPFDIIKIDRVFMTDFNLNRDDAAIVKAIISLGHNMDMKVVAEGVERAEQYMFLNEYGCDQFQGYLFYPPLPEIDVIPALQATVGEGSFVGV